MPAHGRSNIDYKEAERKYVVEGMSVRAIARELGLKSWSSMNEIANREDWKGKRAAYMAAIARRAYESSAAAIGDEKAQLRDAAMAAGAQTLIAYVQGLKDGSIKPNARDAQVWAAFLLSVTTEGPADTSGDIPDLRNVTPPDADLLRAVVEAARERVAPTGGVGPTALVVSPTTRPN